MGPDFSIMLDAVGPHIDAAILAVLAAGVALVVLNLAALGVRKIKAAVYWALDDAWASGSISRQTRDKWQGRVRF